MPPKADDRLTGKYIVIRSADVRFWFCNSNDEITMRFVPPQAEEYFFALRLDADPAARVAALAYADAIEATAPTLAADLRAKVAQYEPQAEPSATL